MDSANRDAANADPLCLNLRKAFRPCPLCQADIEVWEQLGPQAVECGVCGLNCTIDASPPPVALAAPLIKPMVDVSPAVEHWLAHTPKPVRPELTPEGRRARRQRKIAAAAGAGVVIVLAIVASRMGYLQANEQFTRRLVQQRTLAQQNERHLLSAKQRLQRERLDAVQRKAAAEREARLMTARYLAAQAQNVAASTPWKGVGTAVNAVNATFLQDGYAAPEAHQSLRDAVARVPMAYGIDGAVLRGHRGAILALAASRNGRWLATGGADHSVRLWDLRAAEGRPRSIVLKQHEADVTHVLFSQDSQWLITGSKDSSACIWNLVADGDSRGPTILPGRQSPITKMAISPNGRWLAIVFASDRDGARSARLWDLSDGPQQARSLELNGQDGRIDALAISPDSRWLAIGVDDTVHMWDLAAHVPAITSVGRQCRHGGVTAALFTNDGKWLVTSGRDGSARLWNLAGGDPSKSLQLAGHRSPVRLLTASTDSRWLVTAGDHSLKIWDLIAQNPATTAVDLAVDSNPLTAAFSHDRRWLAAADDDGSVRLWALDERGPAEAAVRLRASSASTQIAFTPDNHWLATTQKRAVRLWNVDVHDLITRAEAVQLARKQSITYRYLWLNQRQTLIGNIASRTIAASRYALAWRSLQPQRATLQSAADEAAMFLARRWSQARPQVAQRLTAQAAPDASLDRPIASAKQPTAAKPPTPGKARYVAPRHATQGNTLRLYVR